MTDAVLIDAAGVVVQVNRDAAAADMPPNIGGAWVDAPLGEVSPGMLRKNGKFVSAPPGPAPVPDIISTRQFFQQLAVDGDCTKDDALAYVRTGVLPKVLSDVIATLPADTQFAVNMQVIGANEFSRTAEAVALLGQLLQKDGAALDRIWREAAKL